jgi:hypothetical protein
MVGSDREHERHAAADQAYRLCDENDLSLSEALEGSFSASNEDDLQHRIDELEEDNRQLAEAVNVLNAQQHAIPEDAGRQLVAKIWSYPQTRLVWLLFGVWCVSTSMAFLEEVYEHIHKGLGQYWGWVAVAGLARFLWDWACAEYSRLGVAVVVLKTVVVVAGSAFALTCLTPDTMGTAIVLLIVAALTVTNGARWLADQLAHSDDEIFATLRSWFA